MGETQHSMHRRQVWVVRHSAWTGSARRYVIEQNCDEGPSTMLTNQRNHAINQSDIARGHAVRREV